MDKKVLTRTWIPIELHNDVRTIKNKTNTEHPDIYLMALTLGIKHLKHLNIDEFNKLKLELGVKHL